MGEKDKRGRVRREDRPGDRTPSIWVDYIYDAAQGSKLSFNLSNPGGKHTQFSIFFVLPMIGVSKRNDGDLGFNSSVCQISFGGYNDSMF